MNSEEIRAGLREASGLPMGRVKSERLELLATAAKTNDDRGLEANILLELSRAYSYGGESHRQPLVFARLLKLLDEFPGEVGGSTHSIHWQLKWMTSSLVHNAEVPLPTVYRWLDELESRYRQRGHSPRPVHALRSSFALTQGEYDAASVAMEAAIAAPRDQMADCDACERSRWGGWRTKIGDDEGALEFWAPVIDGLRRCAEQPHSVLGQALLPLVRLGRVDEARSAYLKGYPLVRRNISLRETVGEHIEFCALTGNEARGLEILAEHVGWLVDQQEAVTERYDFCGGVAVLLRRLVALGHGDIPVGDKTATVVLAALEKELTEIAARYDRRNGNTYTSDRLAARLGQEPLIDWLPLGMSASLPQVTAAGDAAPSAAGSAPAPATAELWEAVRPTAVLADQELRDGDPVAAEKLARQALQRGGPLIPQEAAAQLYTVLAEALRQQPDRELDLVDAALKASARWDGVSEPDMLHHRFTAAGVYHGLGRHAEAVALFEDVIGRVDVPYDRLGVARTRRAYGESLRALRKHRDAAEQLLLTAALLQDDASNVRPYAEVAWAAAESLRDSGQRGEASVAYERAAALWESLGEVGPDARCRRSIAWLLFQTDQQRAVELMREVLAWILETVGDEQDPEVAETENQLKTMVTQVERQARYAAAQAARGEDDEDDEDDEDE